MKPGFIFHFVKNSNLSNQINQSVHFIGFICRWIQIYHLGASIEYCIYWILYLNLAQCTVNSLYKWYVPLVRIGWVDLMKTNFSPAKILQLYKWLCQHQTHPNLHKTYITKQFLKMNPTLISIYLCIYISLIYRGIYCNFMKHTKYPKRHKHHNLILEPVIKIFIGWTL